MREDYSSNIPFPFGEEWTVEKKLGQGSYGVVYLISRGDAGSRITSAMKWIPLPPDESEIRQMLDRAAVSSAGVDHVINTAKGTDKCTDLGEGAYKVPRRKPGETGYDTYIYVSFFGDKFSRVQTLDFTFMLRLDEQSSVGKTEKVSLSVQGFKTFFTCITDLMDELYENTGLEGSELTLEVYVSGQYLGKQIIPLER